jgi:hypothetical protein
MAISACAIHEGFERGGECDHWRMRVDDLRKDKDNNVWVIGVWFLKKDDVAGRGHNK